MVRVLAHIDLPNLVCYDPDFSGLVRRYNVSKQGKEVGSVLGVFVSSNMKAVISCQSLFAIFKRLFGNQGRLLQPVIPW